MKLTILGSGTYVPELERHSASYLVEVGRQKIVFDFGRGAIDQLLRIGIHYYDINAIFISHLHADHWADLGALLQPTLAPPAAEPHRKKDITIYGPKGTKQAIAHLLRAFYLERYHPPYKVVFKELLNESTVRGLGWDVKSYTVRHADYLHALGYRVTASRKVLAYSGDTGDCPAIRTLCKNADVAILEAGTRISYRGHMTAREAAQAASDAGVKKLVLSHMSTDHLKTVSVLAIAKKEFEGRVVIAKDLMKIKM